MRPAAFGEVDRPHVDPGQHSGRIAREAARERSLDRRRRGREGGDRVLGPAGHVVGGEADVLFRPGLQGQAQLGDMVVAGDQPGIAAGQRGDVGGGALDIVEHAHVRRRDHRIAELLSARRLFLVGVRHDETDRVDRRPVRAIAQGLERAEVREMILGDIEIGRELAEERQEIVCLARDRYVEIELAADRIARHRTDLVAAESIGSAIEAAHIATHPDAGRDVASGQLEQRPVEQRVEPGVVGDGIGAVGRARAEPLQRTERVGGGVPGVDPRLEVGDVQAGVGEGPCVAVIIVAGQRPAPFRADIAVERGAQMRRERGAALCDRQVPVQHPVDDHVVGEGREGVAGGQVERRSRQAVEPHAVGIFHPAVQRGRDIAEDRSCVDAVRGEIATCRQQTAIRGLIGRVGVIRGRAKGAKRRHAACGAGRHARDRHRAPGEGAQRGIDLSAFGADDIAADRKRAWLLRDIALAFGQPGLPFIFHMQGEAAIAVEVEQIELAVRIVVPAGGRHLVGQLDGGRAEAAAQDDIHHLLVGGIAIFQRDLLGQDVDARDRLGRQVANLREAGNALAVEQHHRRAAAATAAGRLRCQFGQQVGNRTDSVGPDVRRAELLLGLDVADHRAGQVALPPHDDVRLVRVGLVVGLPGRGGAGRRGRRCSRCFLGCGQRGVAGRCQQEQDADTPHGHSNSNLSRSPRLHLSQECAGRHIDL
ncbi:Lead, cadmium, zinc and mercury transporting ATPase; Copper-translocating P-type ATPase [hydrothermal vent metagenome]|uniref:Lead, cadmium, zinc and mercury transporting ATPase Copper-translocating P-type ATPase n=1 Tax=hydrothermal vent metagenome TaxID=652676 RepID=A0A160TN79_9ZZZZ